MLLSSTSERIDSHTLTCPSNELVLSRCLWMILLTIWETPYQSGKPYLKVSIRNYNICNELMCHEIYVLILKALQNNRTVSLHRTSSWLIMNSSQEMIKFASFLENLYYLAERNQLSKNVFMFLAICIVKSTLFWFGSILLDFCVTCLVGLNISTTRRSTISCLPSFFAMSLKNHVSWVASESQNGIDACAPLLYKIIKIHWY